MAERGLIGWWRALVGGGRAASAKAADGLARSLLAEQGGQAGMREIGEEGSTEFAGRYQERYLKDLRGPAGLQKMAAMLRREGPCFVANRIILLSASPAEWTVAPGGKSAADTRAAAFVAECMEDMSSSWWEAVSFALSSLAFGFADLEIVWKRRLGPYPSGDLPPSKYDDGLVGLRKLGVRRQETVDRWDIDDNGGHQAMYQKVKNGQSEVRIPIEKLLHVTFGDDRGGWEGIGWLEPAYKDVHMKEALEVLEGVGYQRSHVGLPVFGYKQPSVSDALKSMVRAMGKGLVVNSNQYVAYPEMLVSFDLKTTANPNAADLRERIKHLEWNILMLALVTFLQLGSTATGTFSLGQSLEDVFAKSVDGALDLVADVMNRHLVPRLIEVNAPEFGGITMYPTMEHASISELSPQVLGFLDAAQRWFSTARDEDVVWLRNAIRMPEMSVEQVRKEREEREAEAERIAAEIAHQEAAARAQAEAEAEAEREQEQEEEQPPEEGEAPPAEEEEAAAARIVAERVALRYARGGAGAYH